MRKNEFLSGIRAGIPISFGYLAIMIGIGIFARKLGMSAGYAIALSISNVTSAGTVEAIKIIAENGSYFAITAVTLVVNLRYVLMSASIAPKVTHFPIYQKMIMAYGLTDEIYAISVTRQKRLTIWFVLGIYGVAVPMWVLGTFLGVFLGEKLPPEIVLSLQVCLFGMFLAIILPPTKKHKNITLAVVLSMGLNGLIEILKRATGAEFFVAIEHYRVIFVVIVVSLLLAIVAPVKKGEEYA